MSYLLIQYLVKRKKSTSFLKKYCHCYNLFFLIQELPNTRHRLCLWHIQKNATSHYGSLRSNTNFKEHSTSVSLNVMMKMSLKHADKLWSKHMNSRRTLSFINGLTGYTKSETSGEQPWAKISSQQASFPHKEVNQQIMH